MDYVYICRSGDNEELRYSIRSVVKNAPKANIWVVGGKPDWYSGNHIHVDQRSTKYNNARLNLRILCQSKEISDKFVLMNDDFFIIDKINKIETYHGGLLETKLDTYEALYPTSSYTKMLGSTFNQLSKKGFRKPLDYELHVPMIMDKEKLHSTLKYKSMLWRSVYGNFFNSGGIPIVDVKVYPEGAKPNSYDWKNSFLPYLSTMDETFEGEVLEFMKKKFPKASPYEVQYL